MKILILTPRLYGSTVGSGGGVLCFNQVTALAREHEVVLLAFEEPHSASDQSMLEELKMLGARVYTVPLATNRFQSIRCKANLYLRSIPAQVTSHFSPQMRAKLMEVVRTERPNGVLIQFPWMAQYVEHVGSCPAVMDVQDSFSVSGYRRIATEQSLLPRMHAYVNWLAWIGHERRYYRRFREVVVLTEQDRYGLTVFSPDLRPRVSPPAIRVPTFAGEKLRRKNRIGFVGSFSHGPNRIGLKHFIVEVFPHVLLEEPDVELVIAGRAPPSELRRFESERVRFCGYVEDIGAFFREAAVVVVPLLSGGGIKVKTLEALANSAAVVSTSIGAEEIGARDGEHLLIRDGTGEFATGVVRLLRDAGYAQRLGQAGRALVEKRFSWEERAREFAQILKNACEPTAGMGTEGSRAS